MPTPTIKTWLEQATNKLKTCNFITQAHLEAELLASFVLKSDRLHLQLQLDNKLSSNQLATLEQILNQRLANYPLAYITGQKEFFGRSFMVDERVLIPRPESEIMIEQALEIVNNNFITQASSTQPTELSIVDIGCGSGALGLTLACELQQQSINYQLTLADISPSALAVAQLNAERLRVKADFVTSDLLSQLTTTDNPFNLILANLPYVDRQWSFIQNVEHEPELALYANNQGLALIFRLIDQLAALNNKTIHSWLLLESDPLQHPAIADYLAERHFRQIKQLGYITIAKLSN